MMGGDLALCWIWSCRLDWLLSPRDYYSESVYCHGLGMSCGGLILDTTKSCKHPKALAATGAVSEETSEKNVPAWRECEYLR